MRSRPQIQRHILDRRQVQLVLVCLLLVTLLPGCVGTQPTRPARTFDFTRDTFSFANELNWVYTNTPDGRWTTVRRDPPPEYSLHCYVMSRGARQFFDHAAFNPAAPHVPAGKLPGLIRSVVHADGNDVVELDGYADLREFSAVNEALLKANCGGAWRCYAQRGNWRFIWPFTRAGQDREARRLAEGLARGRLPIVHLGRFPQLTINHAVLLFAATTNATGIDFLAYDPNQPARPQPLRYDAATRTFLLPRTEYFAGGRVDVYEIYRDWTR